ncbi:MAG TPA: GDP-L-fucose synthase, partial [Novosphingobium sp.]|nr:GDP-L-fucose synthase [Novosphingobium sp.]
HGYPNLVTRTHAELDLVDGAAVARFFAEQQPQVVFIAAAKVGGILANNTYPANFIRENLAIQTNLIHEAYRAGVKKLVFLGSSCIYPRDCPQPIREDYLLTGPLEPTNRPYAIAKIAGIEMCWSYNRQYGTQYLCAMPTNLYGPGDNYDLATSHVVPALIRKVHAAKAGGADVAVWGSGTPRREFLHVDDCADACVHLLRTWSGPGHVNVGVGEDVTIAELAAMIVEVAGSESRVVFDPAKPDGAPRKLLDVAKLAALGWRASIPLREGLARTYAEYAAQN